MLKRKFSKLGELGSMMVEALAMLGLISMVTPIIYKKAAERNTELQDINAASQARNLMSSVDEYIQDNFAKITEEDVVKNKCKGFTTVDYSDFSNDDYIDIDIRHLCDYLPYGFLYEDANQLKVSESRVFDEDYKVVIKRVVNPTNNRQMLTGFLVAQPRQGSDFPKIRASRISSLIGGNGGYVEGDKAYGVQGIWTIDDIKDELGLKTVDDEGTAFGTVSDGAIIVASMTPITSGQGADSDEVLYRTYQKDPRKRNIMETNLLMGENAATGFNIENINQAVISAGNDKAWDHLDNPVDKAIERARSLWVKGGAGTLLEGVLAIADENSGNVTFEVTNEDGALMASSGAFAVEAGGRMIAADGKFVVEKEGGFQAADENFVVDEEGNTTIKGKATIENTLYARGKVVIGEDDPEDGYELTVRGNAIILGALKVRDLKADTVDTGILRAGKSGEIGLDDPDSDYTMIVDADSLAVGVDKFSIQRASGDTRIKGGEFTVTDDGDTVDLLHVNQTDGYTYARGLRAGEGSQGEFPFEVEPDGDITMQLMESGNQIVGYNIYGGEIFALNNNYSSISKRTDMSTMHSTLLLEDAKATLTSELETGIGSTLELGWERIFMDLMSDSSNPSFEMFKDTVDSTSKVNTYLKKSSSFKIMENINDPVLYVDSTGSDKSPTKWADRATKGSVYIRRGAIELETNNDAMYKKPQFVADKDKGYISADMLISRGVDRALDRNDHFYSGGDISGMNQYDVYMVNPAYTSVMHDIKLTTRGGARLSDIMPDFINKGIYVADNTFSESVGDWSNISATKDIANINKSHSCETKYSPEGSAIWGCETSPWMGVIPTPQCPPGYLKVLQLMPYGFKMATAGVPTGSGRFDFYEQEHSWTQAPYDDSREFDPVPLYFQKSTQLRARINQIGADSNFTGWSIVMGFVYPWNDRYREAYNYFNDNRIQVGTDNFIWNLYPVYYRELEAYGNVFCYFERSNFNSNYVDTNYDQLNNFRWPTDKSNASNINSLDDPNMDYKNPW